jgi:hypothetical protein
VRYSIASGVLYCWQISCLLVEGVRANEMSMAFSGFSGYNVYFMGCVEGELSFMNVFFKYILTCCFL